MGNKTIGMNIGYRKVAIVATLVLLVGLFLPFLNVGNSSLNIVSLVLKLTSAHATASAIIYLVEIIGTVLLTILSILLLVAPSKFVSNAFSCVAAVETVAYVVTMFATKKIVDGAGILSDSFLVKNFSVGYWIGFIAIFVALFGGMKTSKIHPGYIVLVILSVIWLFPILWIVLTALREEQGYYVGYFFPKGLTFKNFTALFADTSLIHFGRWWTNTLIVAVCNCVISTALVLSTAFALSKTRFKSRMGLMKTALIIGMFPGFMSMIAVYNILKGLGIAQTLWALIIVNAAGAAMGYYIVKGFFDTIPKSLDEAAILDGATKWQIFTKITIPMSKSVIIYTVLTSFMGPWGDYIFPSMMLGDNQSQYTVALGLNWLTDFRRIDTYYTQFAAGALLVSLPIVILFIALQKFYVEGMSGAVKG